MKHPIVGLIAFVFVVAPVVTNAQIYNDNNSYFAAIPPSGWKLQTYPSETVRSKVGFNDPRAKGVGIRIIAGPVPRSGYSLDDLLAENKEKIDTVLKTKFPSGAYSVSKANIGDRIAVVQKNSIPGILEQKVVMFVNKNIWYSVAFSATSKKDYESVATTFQKFLNSFTILDSGRKFSEAEMKDAVLAKYKRLAKIYEQDGNIAEALAWIKEGLEVDPSNRALLDVQARLTKRQK
jgi:tetratricopeptide (TPR) repeat protein